MWTYRLGPARAKQMMFTGDVIDGRTAAAWGLANESVPAERLEEVTARLAARIAGVPRSHLAMHEMVVNQVMLTMGLEQTQQMATLFDGVTRHNPEGMWFRRYAQQEGFKAAVQWRDGDEAIPEGDAAREQVRARSGARGAAADRALSADGGIGRPPGGLSEGRWGLSEARARPDKLSAGRRRRGSRVSGPSREAS